MLETEVLRKSRHSGCLYTRVPLFWLSCQLEFHIRTRDGFTFVLSRDSFVSEGLWWFRTSLRVFFLICVLPWSSVDSSTIECFIAWSKYRSFTFLLNFVFNFFFFTNDSFLPSFLIYVFWHRISLCGTDSWLCRIHRNAPPKFWGASGFPFMLIKNSFSVSNKNQKCLVILQCFQKL